MFAFVADQRRLLLQTQLLLLLGLQVSQSTRQLVLLGRVQRQRISSDRFDAQRRRYLRLGLGRQETHLAFERGQVLVGTLGHFELTELVRQSIARGLLVQLGVG